MKKRITEKLKARSGQAIVEFALVLPLLLVLLMGVVDFGWIFVNEYQVERAAASAARYGSINVNRYKESANRADYLSGLKGKAVDSLPDNVGNVVCVEGSGVSQAGTTVVSVRVSQVSVTVTVSCPIRTLTFVAGSLYGEYYTATSTSVSSY